MVYAKYPQYKKTNLEWLEDIPFDWDYGGLTKYLDNIVDYRGKTPEKVEEGVFLVTAKNIKNGKVDYSLSQEFVKLEEYEEIMRRGLPEIGDVLFTTEAPLGEVANVDRIDIALAQRIIKFRGIENVLDNYYLKYWIQSQGFQSNLKTFATGSTAAGIKASKLSSLKVLLPPYSEQKQIVLFLDNKVHELDALIAQKEQMISLLEEKRQSMITEAVTKGLNPNVKMKDSGVKWIGEVPLNWKVKPLYTIYKENKTKNKDNLVSNVLSLSYGKIKQRDIESNYGLLPDSFETYQIVEKDYLILRLTDLQNDKRSLRVGLVNEKGIITSAYIGLKKSPILNSRYAYYLLHSYDLAKVFYGLGSGVRQSIGYAELKKLPILIPDLEEQNALVEYLDNMNSQTEDIIEDLKKQIQNLKAYRQSLIYEAVTGKIDVREYELVPQ